MVNDKEWTLLEKIDTIGSFLLVLGVVLALVFVK